MPAPISAIGGVPLLESVRPAGQPSSRDAFQEVLSTAIQSVEAVGKDAEASVERFLSGEGEELHTTILATRKAELSFELFLQMRNKAISAYQEIMRMPM